LKAKIFLLVLLGLSLLVIPAGMGHASSVDNLIVNPGFEDGTDNFPAGWEITGSFSGSSHKGINKCYFWDKTVFRSGESSLCLFNERASEDFGKAHGRMLCISQAVNVLSDNTYYQFSFWSKGEKVSLNDESVVRVAAVITGEGEFKTIYKNFAKFATEENYDWKEVKNNIFVPKGATKIAIYIQLDGKTTSGRVWFDDFSLCDKSNLSQYKQSFPFSTEFDRKIADVTKNLLAGLLLSGIIASKASDKLGVPALLLFLAIGILAGSEGLGGLHFDYPNLAQTLGVFALAFILFAGGLDTKFNDIKPVFWKGLALSTIGVTLTAVVTGLFAHYILRISLIESMLIGSIVSSTDAAAVFAVLRSKKVKLKDHLKSLLEFESGSNDPMAVFLTTGLIGIIAGRDVSFSSLIPSLIVQMLVGGIIGYFFGKASIFLVNKLRLG
jgi:hypothetical protein